MVAVENEIDTGIDVAVLDLRVRRDIRPPFGRIVADEIVALAGQLAESRHARRRVRAP